MPETTAPLREPTYYTLAALLDGPLHGYGIMKRVQELSRARVRLSAGTLYAALDRLASSALIEVDRQEVVAGRPRRYYQLTNEGRRALQIEGQRLAEAASLVIGRNDLAIASGGAA
jgi:DNA-binding PadR family transcriptional regulator